MLEIWKLLFDQKSFRSSRASFDRALEIVELIQLGFGLHVACQSEMICWRLCLWVLAAQLVSMFCRRHIGSEHLKVAGGTDLSGYEASQFTRIASGSSMFPSVDGEDDEV